MAYNFVTMIDTVRVVQYPAEYNFNTEDVANARARFPDLLVADDGVTKVNAKGKPITAEGGGVLMVVDNSDGKSFPDANARTLQVEPTSGWVTDEDAGGFVHTAIAETLEEMGHPIWSGPIAHRLHNWSTYQPFTGKRICTFGLVLKSGSEEIRNLTWAARAINEWPEDETRYFGALTGRPLVSHTTKVKIEDKTGKETSTTVTETGLRKALQGLGVVAFADVANLFDHLDAQIKADSEAWEKDTLAKLGVEGALTVADAIKATVAVGAEETDALRVAKRGFNPLASAKALGQKPHGKVRVQMLVDTTLKEQDSSSKEPKAKRTRVAAGEWVPSMIRAHILLNMKKRWEDIKKDVTLH